MAAFLEWQQKKAVEHAATSRDKPRRKKASRARMLPPPLPPPPPELCIARRTLAISRDEEGRGTELESLRAGTRVRVLERKTLADGTERARVSFEAQQAALGWVTSRAVGERLAALLKVAEPVLGGPPPPCSPEIAAWLASLAGGKHERFGEEQAWAAALGNSMTFRVLRMKQTETAHEGAYIDHFAEGTYECAGCRSVLYASSHKFASKCGWPSFSDNVPGALERLPGRQPGRQVEIMCSSCGGHIGHVFSGPYHPPPKCERHCVNSASLVFVSLDPRADRLTAEVDAPPSSCGDPTAARVAPDAARGPDAARVTDVAPVGATGAAAEEAIDGWLCA